LRLIGCLHRCTKMVHGHTNIKFKNFLFSFLTGLPTTTGLPTGVYSRNLTTEMICN